MFSQKKCVPLHPMKRNIIAFFIGILILAIVGHCIDPDNRASSLYEQIEEDYDSGRYHRVLFEIDSLRRTYPNAVDTRNKALKIYQEASLKIAQARLARMDSVLQVAEKEYAALHAVVEEKRRKGTMTHAELQRHNELEAYCDSLRRACRVEGSKIRYIHRRQKE